MRKPDRPALVAIDGVLGALWHWSSAVSVLAVVPVAHLLAVHGAGDQAGTVLQASFAVFALLLPAVALLRDYFKKRTDRLNEVLRERGKILDERAADNIQRAGKDLTESFQAERKIFNSLQAQRKIFERLGRTVSPLQRGVVLTIVATLASSAAVVAPTSTLWKHAPRWLVFNLAELLTAIALVCLAGAVVAMLPFTWYLLIGPGEVDEAQWAASVPEPPSSNLYNPLNDQVGLTYDSSDEAYANACLAEGKFADAIRTLERLLARRARLLGSDNPSTLRTRDRLASAYLQVGRATDAIPVFEKLYDAWKRVLSPHHSETLRVRDNFAAARWSVARAADEIPAFERLLIDRERVLGPDHSETLRARDNLAKAYLTAGRAADAILVFERIAADREQACGSDHPDTLRAQEKLANACLAAGGSW